MLKIAVLVSGGGTNLQALLDAERDGVLHSGKISLVVADRPGCYALERAAARNVETVQLYRKKAGFQQKLLETLQQHEIDVVVLAGFLSILGSEVIAAFPNRILNVHPALIPSFCGDGFYGLKVHEAALARGVKVTGATVHIVNEVTDGGPIVDQMAVRVEEGDTPEILQKRVMEQAEWILLPRATETLCSRILKEK